MFCSGDITGALPRVEMDVIAAAGGNDPKDSGRPKEIIMMTIKAQIRKENNKQATDHQMNTNKTIDHRQPTRVLRVVTILRNQ